jgi:hypothetical protein
VISGFRRGFNELCALVGCYAAYSSVLLTTFQDIPSVPSSLLKRCLYSIHIVAVGVLKLCCMQYVHLQVVGLLLASLRLVNFIIYCTLF